MAKNGTDRTKTNWGRSKESRMLHSAASDLSRSRHCIFPKVVVAHQKAWIFERTPVQNRVNHQIIIIAGARECYTSAQTRIGRSSETLPGASCQQQILGRF